MSATAERCYDAMLRLGVARAEAHFSGGNDEGGYDDEVTFVMADESAEVPPKLQGFDVYDESARTARWDSTLRRYVEVQTDGKDEDKLAIAGYLSAVLDGSYGGFSGDFSVYGAVHLDARARTTRIAGEESGYTPFERTIGSGEDL